MLHHLGDFVEGVGDSAAHPLVRVAPWRPLSLGHLVGWLMLGASVVGLATA
jgi:hypothetical protein